MIPDRIDVLGVPVDCVNMQQAVAIVDAMIAGDQPQTIIATNPEKVMKARGDNNFLRQLKSAGLLIPDGIGVVIAARILGLASLERVPGSELMPAICELAAAKGYKIYLFGGDREVNLRTRKVLLERYPRIQVVGNCDGYVADERMPMVIDDINRSSADILFLALGSPRQEQWMDAHLSNTSVKVCQGVGGTFDVIAGKVNRAPLAFRKMHLEWLYRLLSNPRRIHRQTALPKFLIAVLKYRLLMK